MDSSRADPEQRSGQDRAWLAVLERRVVEKEEEKSLEKKKKNHRISRIVGDMNFISS